MTSTQAQHERRHRRCRLWLGLLLASSVATSANAQGSDPAHQPTPIRDAIIRAASNPPPVFSRDAGREASRQQSSPRRERSIQRKILGGIVGGVAGFFAGGYLGAAIEGDGCHCDDPGLVGALIGAPVGGVAGSVLGYHFLF